MNCNTFTWSNNETKKLYSHHEIPSETISKKMNGKFEVLDHEPCPRACGPTVLNFYKKQMKSEECEICNDIIISYVDAMVKI